MGLIAQAAMVLSMGAAMAGAETRFAVRYADGVFEQVARNRGMSVARCMAASPVHPLGAWLTIEGQTGARLKCKVLDTSHPRDRQRHIRMRIVEVDPKSGAILCGVRWQGKASECKVKVRDGTTPD